MNFNLSEEQLNKLDQSELIKLILEQQKQIEKMDLKLQKFLEEIADSNRRRFGRSSEAFNADGQLSFGIVDENLVIFNEIEAIHDEEVQDNPGPVTKPKRPKGKKEADLSKLDVVEVTPYDMSDEELAKAFPDEGYKRLPDEVLKRYYFVPSKVGVEEIHIAVYSGAKSEKMASPENVQ